MRKLMLVVFCVFSIGCNNPISSKIDKEGDKTRAELQAEVEIARQEIVNEVTEMLTLTKMELNGTLISVLEYINGTTGVRR